MLQNGFAPIARLTALGALVSLLGLTLAPLAHAQQAAPASAAKPAVEKPAAKKAEVKAEAKLGVGKADAKATADAAKGPDKKTRDAARKAYGAGEKAYGDGKYADAYDNFTKANSLIASPHAQFWIAKSLDKQDKKLEAISAYQVYLANPDASRTGEERVTEAKTRLEELQLSQVALLSLTTVPKEAAVALDGAPVPGLSPYTIKLAPGPHKLGFNAPGFEPKEVDVDAKAGDKLNQTVELAVKPPPPPPPAPTPEPVAAAPAPLPPPAPVEKRSKAPAYVTLGIAGAAAIVGGIFGAKALGSKSDFNKNPTTKSADDTERNALIADMAFGVAITLGVTGIVLLTSDDDAPKEAAYLLPPKAPKVDFSGYAGKTGGGASAKVTF